MCVCVYVCISKQAESVEIEDPVAVCLYPLHNHKRWQKEGRVKHTRHTVTTTQHSTAHRRGNDKHRYLSLVAMETTLSLLLYLVVTPVLEATHTLQ